MVLVGLVAGCGGSSTSQASSTQQSARDRALTTSIDAALQQSSIPGAIVGVWQEGKAPYVRSFGVRDTATGQPMATNLYQRIGSTSTSFVVTAVLQLVDQGKVGLDDPIDAYVPGVPDGPKITIRQLAGMRSGLYKYSGDIVPKVVASDPQRQWMPQQLLGISFNHPLLFPPGTEFDYSDTNTILLGLVVETASGQPLDAYIDQHILGPDHLAHTVYPTGAALPAPHAEGYTNWTPQGLAQPNGATLNATDWNPSWAGAAGAMISTLDDLRTWTRDLATGRLLKPTTQAQRMQFLPAPEAGAGAQYGLGIENHDGWIGHSGNIAGYMTQPMYLPSQRMTMVVLVNSNAEVSDFVKLTQAITNIISPANPWPSTAEPPGA
jgi:D-alanyl-D-alanine carboxypeptidase